MRHGEAMSAAEWRKPDADRPLTKMGVAKLEAGLQEMKRVGFAVPTVVTSPYARALETARLVSRHLALAEPISRNELISGAHHKALFKVVSELALKSPVLMVGHMPEIAIFGTRITNTPRIMDQGLQPADILAIEVSSSDLNWEGGKLLWWRKIEEWKTITS